MKPAKAAIPAKAIWIIGEYGFASAVEAFIVPAVASVVVNRGSTTQLVVAWVVTQFVVAGTIVQLVEARVTIQFVELGLVVVAGVTTGVVLAGTIIGVEKAGVITGVGTPGVMLGAVQAVIKAAITADDSIMDLNFVFIDLLCYTHKKSQKNVDRNDFIV
jgi:uncharacterized membrane protein (UPF0136 family)